MSVEISLKGQVALVTGAAGGIGRAVCEALHKAGAAVVATDVMAEDVQACAASLGDGVRALTLDVSNEAAWAAVTEDILAQERRIDILVNNAGILLFKLLEETSIDEFKRLLDINVVGTLLGMQAVVPTMKAAGSGTIVNVSSSSAILPNNATGAYAASKYAVRGLTRAAALELAPSGIRVNSVHPASVNTPMINPTGLSREEMNSRFKFVPQQRGCDPEEVAHSIRFLVSDQASYCNGMELVVDGGLTAGQYFFRIPGAPNLKG